MLRTLLAIHQKSLESCFWEVIDSFILLWYASLAALRTLLCQLLACLNFRRFFLLAQMKKVISMNYGSSTSSWKPKTLRWMRLDLILTMSYKNINSILNPLKKITSSSWRTKSKDILPWNISQMIIKMEQSAVKLAEDAFNPEILDEFVKVLKYPSIKDVMVACNLMLQVFPCFNGDVEKLSLHFF